MLVTSKTLKGLCPVCGKQPCECKSLATDVEIKMRETAKNKMRSPHTTKGEG